MAGACTMSLGVAVLAAMQLTSIAVGRLVNEARAHSRHAILMQVKRDDALSFVAVPIG